MILRQGKKFAERILRRYPPLFAAASRAYHSIHSSFRPLSPGAPAAIESALVLHQQLSPQVPGDYYEFGLFRGYTFWWAQQAAIRAGLGDMRFWGFDSFAGLPPVEGVDATNGQFFEHQFACSKAEVMRNLGARGVDWSRTTLVEGYFGDVLTPNLKRVHPFSPVGVAFLDCDLYASTREALNWLAEFLRPASILLFDDWHSFGGDPALGQPRAFREFLAANPQLQVRELGDFQYHGRSFLIDAA